MQNGLNTIVVSSANGPFAELTTMVFRPFFMPCFVERGSRFETVAVATVV